MAPLSPRWLLLPAACVAAAMPVLLLRGGAPPGVAAPAERPLGAPPEAPPLAAAFARPLFAATTAEAGPVAPDAPALVGVVGRLMHDAVALVRTADGSTRTLAPGESVDGWRLESLAADAAYFTRGSQRARVPMPEE
ncbi:hypothetical protein ACBY01_10785 [Sphingomonas sp. ac-8]|uniref:hypothetical protein n=1 Tax=Sphingomonas sp. ac-8 TaxID=3242977 RepID=UPI003A804111